MLFTIPPPRFDVPVMFQWNTRYHLREKERFKEGRDGDGEEDAPSFVLRGKKAAHLHDVADASKRRMRDIRHYYIIRIDLQFKNDNLRHRCIVVVGNYDRLFIVFIHL